MDRSQAGHRDYCNKKIATWLGIGSRCSSSSSSSSSLYKGEEKEEEEEIMAEQSMERRERETG
jgi:hypothetical protein